MVLLLTLLATQIEKEKNGYFQSKLVFISPPLSVFGRRWEEIDGREEPVDTVEKIKQAMHEPWEALTVERITKRSFLILCLDVFL